MKKQYALSIFLLATLAANTSAQNLQDSLKTKDISEVIMVSSRSPKQISDIPGTVWVIGQKELQTQIRGGAGLKEVLGNMIPGFDFGNQGRTNYAQNMRGRNVLVMINGISINSTRATSRQFDAIDPFNIERIEVLSGASSIYGGDSTGGIINIITKKPTSNKLAFETSVGLKSGFHKDDLDKRIAQSVEGGTDKVKFRLGAAFTQNEGAFDANGDQIITDVKQADFQYNRSIDLLGGISAKLAPNQDLNVDLQYYNSKVRNKKWLSFGQNFVGFTTKNPDLINVLDGADSDLFPRTERFMVNLNYNVRNIWGGQDLILQAYGRREEVDFGASFAEVPKPPAGVVLPVFLSSARGNTNAYGAKLVLNKKWNAFNFTYGVDVDLESFTGDQAIFNPQKSAESGGLVNQTDAFVGRYPDTKTSALSGFIQADWNITDKLTFSGGVRQQLINVKLDDFVGFKEQVYMHFGYGNSADAVKGGKNNYDVTLLNANLLYKFNPSWQTWLNFSQGFAVPDAAKSYGFGKYQLSNNRWNLLNSMNIAEQPLSGIKTDQMELGFRHNRTSEEGLSAQGSVFYALSNKTLKIDNAAFTISLLDQKLRNYGFEGALSYRFAQGLELGGNVLLMQSETETVDKGWQNQSVYTTNPSKFMVFTGWNAKRFSLRLQMQNSMNYTDLADMKINGYTLFDLVGDVKLNKGVINFGVQNIFNKQYTTIWGQRSVFFYGAPQKAFAYQGRGTTFSVGYTINY
ncbi:MULTISPECIES: TonB-dependent receptor [Chryseobacterium]|uniref:TonB-dependent receptor n=1 Tax=Chryseobacterium TaxID=59732 RepID=UPI0019577FC1|nr:MULTISPECIES: TonB-dependent receptor [Chryseobacterium]MBM7418756.1 iron complex outermembrane receptor protein [Chryseobacterium sp. JUb44]WSO11547.1 TonB-dependent receptor [Chryseobacterium scophthalmum]